VGAPIQPIKLRLAYVYPRLVDHRKDFVDRSFAVGDHMQSDPKYCLAKAIRCIELARRARTLEGRQTFQNLAEEWKGLAADIERAEASLEKLNEKGFRRSPTYPYD
jgi:hypothetical protein